VALQFSLGNDWCEDLTTRVLINMVMVITALFGGHDVNAAGKDRTLTLQAMAFAPNAGGQEAYAVRMHQADREYSLFANRYLMAGQYPLVGGVYSVRFPVCDETCWWQFFVQLGAGISSAGPLTEIIWGTMIPIAPLWLPRPSPKYLPAIRLDIATQMIIVPQRLVIWSYPLWLGISLPF